MKKINKINKKVVIFSLLLFISITTQAQVGIGTTSPTAQLDVNGDLKVRTTVLKTGFEVAKDSILVIDAGVVKRVTSKQVYDSHIKSFVKGTGATSTNLGLAIGSTGYKRIVFDSEAFDENSDYNTATYEFTSPKNGIYSVYLQYHLTSLISATNVGVAIFTDRSGTITLEAEEVYSNLSLLGIDLSPPTRQINTLLKLNAGEKIFFGASSGVAITLVGGTKSFFTIMQVE